MTKKINFVLTTLLILWNIKSLLGNHSLFEEAELIRSVSKHFECKSIIFVNGLTDSIDRKISLEKYLRYSFSYYIAVWNIRALIENIYTDQNWIPSRSLLVIDYNLIKTSELNKILTKINMAAFDWLILSTLNSIDFFHFKNMKIPFNCRFIVSSVQNNNTTILYEVYQISSDSDMLIKRFGYWNIENGFQYLKKGELISTRTDLKGIKLKFAVHNISNNVNPCATTNIDNSKQIIQCAYFSVWKYLERALNFTTKYVAIEDCYQNGTVGLSTPMLETIRTGEADSGEDGYVWSSSRLVHNRFLWPLFNSKVILVTKIPPRKFSFSSYVRPFASKMWFALASWLIFSAITFNFVNYVTIRMIYRKELFCNHNGIIENSFLPLTAISYQASSLFSKEVSIRLVYLIIYLIPVVFIPSYSGSIISALSVPPENLPFTTIQEFEKDGTYILNAVNNTFFQFYLMTDDQFYELRRKKLISKVLSASYEQSLKDICSERVTFMFEWPLLSRHSVNCNVYMFDLSLGKMFSSMAVKKNFPYLEIFNRKIQKLTNSGLDVKMLEKITSNYFKFESKPFPQTYFQVKPFGFKDVLPVFAVLTGGLLLSLIILIIEINATGLKNYCIPKIKF